MSISFRALSEALDSSAIVGRLGSKYGLKILSVDPQKIRSKSLSDQEFGDYWCSDDSKEVEENTLWVASTLSKEEIDYAAEQARKRLLLLARGLSQRAAYERALAGSKAHREKSEKKFLKEVKKTNRFYEKKLGEIIQDDGKVSVWLVNGRAVRDEYKTDFVEGGHGVVYPWIPKSEIWIDNSVPVAERKFILKHEAHERHEMLNGMEYDAAHERAAMAEFATRKQES